MEVVNLVSMSLLYGIVIAAVTQDLARRRISNRLILAGLDIALICRIVQEGLRVVLPCLGNIIFPVVTLYILYLAGILGAGDIKLFSVIGCFLNFHELIYCMVTSFALGALLSLLWMAGKHTFFSGIRSGIRYIADLLQGNWHAYESKEGGEENRMHFSVAILIGLVVSQMLTGLG